MLLTGVRTPLDQVRAGETVQVSCRVHNTGPLPGREVVRVYLRDRVASVVRPDQSLAAFSSIGLAPGQGRDVRLRLPADRFAVWDRGMRGMRGVRGVVDPGAVDVPVVLPEDRPSATRGGGLS